MFNFYTHSQTNTYQGIILTDRANTYFLLTYTCGDIEWSSIGDEAAVVGYNAQSDYFFNHPASGFSSIGDAVSCTSPRNKRQEKLSVFTIGKRVQVNKELVRDSVKCMAFYTVDTEDISEEQLNNEIIPNVEPCPCNSRQASQDKRFQPQPSKENCYTQIVPLKVRTNAQVYTFVQQCCYDPETR